MRLIKPKGCDQTVLDGAGGGGDILLCHLGCLNLILSGMYESVPSLEQGHMLSYGISTSENPFLADSYLERQRKRSVEFSVSMAGF